LSPLISDWLSIFCHHLNPLQLIAEIGSPTEDDKLFDGLLALKALRFEPIHEVSFTDPLGP
jgi:hypothetical protein